MSSYKGTSLDHRLSAAANAKKTELEKFRTRSGTNHRHSPNDRPPVTPSASLAMRALPSVTVPGWPALPVRPPKRPPAMPPLKPKRPPAMPPPKPRRLPAMLLARRGLENDSALSEQVCGPTGDVALDVLVRASSCEEGRQ
jgi:hypothetical protein